MAIFIISKSGVCNLSLRGTPPLPRLALLVVVVAPLYLEAAYLVLAEFSLREGGTE
jgi:hypothetical protein